MAGPLTYQEILRTLGTLLDASGSDSATIVLSPDGAIVHAPSWSWDRHWTRDALILESDRQRSWRDHPRPAHMAGPKRFNPILRVVGAAIDAQPDTSPYTLLVDDQAVRVQGSDGAERVFEAKPLERRLKLAAHLRGQLQSIESTGSPAFPSPLPDPLPDAPSLSHTGYFPQTGYFPHPDGD